ncbi:hypothetical protein RF55_12524 [Lasius niger]|uniref:Integrase catalytic domain-containing protein n=1 Tax=Lasius niger TaxID=67767 RepID=A0A0J7KCJ0_LASNI|nr:hypothetical protein RF55_12524 [Lasius niger]
MCIAKCVTCARQRASLAYQQMGDLPSVRVKPARPFAHTGIDYAGPFSIGLLKAEVKRCIRRTIFLICLFTARRGFPSVVYSDNGNNFQGADRELTKRIREILRDTDLQNRFALEKINWHFIPPAAPQFGGLWEAGVKSVKHHLRRILEEFTPTFEEFSTLLCNIECALNSRPIAPLNDDPEF